MYTIHSRSGNARFRWWNLMDQSVTIGSRTKVRWIMAPDVIDDELKLPPYDVGNEEIWRKTIAKLSREHETTLCKVEPNRARSLRPWWYPINVKISHPVQEFFSPSTERRDRRVVRKQVFKDLDILFPSSLDFLCHYKSIPRQIHHRILFQMKHSVV